MERDRCVNIDWLEVYCLESTEYYPCNAEFFRRHGFIVDEREYGTRLYSEMFTLMDQQGDAFLEIRRNPKSQVARNGGLFPPESCHIRLTNSACYVDGCIDILRGFLVQFHYDLRKIFRLDICMDFEKFDRGDDPAKFIRRYMGGRFGKVNQANVSAHGCDNWNGREWHSLSWGQRKSMVSTKIYCKTLELRQSKDKPYIRACWFQHHLVDDPVTMTKYAADGTQYHPDIWRVEFSIKSSANRWFVVEKGVGGNGEEYWPHSLDRYDTPMKLLVVFANLARHYFHFKIRRIGVRKDRCDDKVLFDFSPTDTFYKIDRLASHRPHLKPLDRLVAHLRNYRDSHYDNEVFISCNFLIDYMQREQQCNFAYDGNALQALRKLVQERVPHEHQEAIQNAITQLTLEFTNEPSNT